MKGSRTASALVALLLASYPALAEDRAAALVNVMRFDFASLDSTIWSIRRKVERGETKAAVSECLGKIDHKRFTSLWANQVASKLTKEEIEIALAFFSSPAGRKYTEYGVVDAHNRFVGSNIEKYPTFSKSEESALLEFGNSVTGLKLTKDHILSNPYPASVAELQKQLILDCSK